MTEGREEYGDYSVDDEDQLSEEDTLEGFDDPLDDGGYETADHYAPDYGDTPWEEAHGESLEQRLKQEIPDPDPYAGRAIDRHETRPSASAEEAAMHEEE